MNLFENWKNVIEKSRKLDAKSLEAIRYFLMGMLILDLFGIYWYLELKKLGGALLMVIVFLLVIVMFLESNLPRSRREVKKMNEQELEPKKPKAEGKSEESKDNKDKKETEETQEVETPNILGEGTGLPSAEEYEKDISKAFGI
ncbi:hypothetical protein LCGC14_2313260 [marine sediment metagenome]|uniref:Uncharacterized protein n=1 Tax=marine sediment metagenome TaxID=412755 RepID=A0A0F9FEV8_9ZZZZ